MPFEKSFIKNERQGMQSCIPCFFVYELMRQHSVEWIMERYQIKTDKASGITNDPNDWATEQGKPRYILDLLLSVITVSVETVKIVNGLPGLEITE